jgi:serine/threonine-protein kinase
MWKGVGDAEVRARVGAGDLPPPPANPGTPAALARICRRALALDPGARPATALALADELEPVLAELGGASPRALGGLVARLFAEPRRRRRAVIEERVGRVAVEVTRTTTELPPMDQLTSGEPTPTPPRPPAARRRLAPAVAVMALALVAALALTRSTRGHHDQPAAPTAIARAPAPAAVGAAPPAPAPLPATPTTPTPPAGGDRIAHPHGEKAASRRSPRAVAPTVEAASPAPVAPPDCAHPFFIDGGGIKKLRPECM